METGWICPVCGRGKAPWVSECDCQYTTQWVYPIYPTYPIKYTYGCSKCSCNPCQCSTTTTSSSTRL